MTNDETVDITITIPRQRMRDILTTAVDQGMGSWSLDEGYVVRTTRDAAKFVTAIEIDAPPADARCEWRPPWTRKRITDLDLAASMADAIKDNDAKHSVWAELSEGNFDAFTADTVVQFCLFGKVVYG